MRKLKLRVQMSVDRYIAGANGEMDWMAIFREPESKLNFNLIKAPPFECGIVVLHYEPKINE